jgi:uncharacterized membrane protein
MKHLYNKDSLLVTLIVGLSVLLWCLPTGYEQAVQTDSLLAKARVVAVDNSDVLQTLIVRSGIQKLDVEVLNGPYRGQRAQAMNSLTGKLELDEVYVAGRTILLEFELDQQGHIRYAVARGNYRLGTTALLMGMFCILLVTVAGWTGCKAVLSFVFSGLVIWKVMIPLYLKGYDPVFTGLTLVLAMIAVITFLVGGLTRRGAVAFLGSLLGLVLTGVLAYLFSRGFRLHGAVRPFAETLLYSGFLNLSLSRLFQAGVVMGASGAVIDLAMDISAAMDEIAKANPRISLRRHLASGMSVGRSVIGTMTTTLLFAYSGSYIAMLMLFMGRGVPPTNFLNMHFVSAEILNVLVGSFGLVTVAPFTALVGSLLFRTAPPPGRQTAAATIHP